MSLLHAGKQNGPRGAELLDLVAGARFGNYLPPCPVGTAARFRSLASPSAFSRL